MPVSTESSETVFTEYGRLMSLVQHWELAQATLWWATLQTKPSPPAGDFDTRPSQKAIFQIQAAYLKMTAQGAREAIADLLDDRTRDDLPDLISERNRLAHRFLREQECDGGFARGTLAELHALGRRFLRSTESLMETMETAGPDYKGPVLPHWPALASRIIDGLSVGRKVPRDPSAQ